MRLVLSTFLLAFAATAFANKPTSLDTQASVIKWVGSKKLGSQHNGTIKLSAGEVTLKNGAPTAGNFTVDLKTIACEDLADDKKTHDKLVGHLHSVDFFDTKNHPTATFVLKSSKPGKAKGEFIVSGDLTMRGKTNPIEFPATINSKDGITTANAKFKVDRTKYGVEFGSKTISPALLADKIINDEFDVELNLVTKK